MVKITDSFALSVKTGSYFVGNGRYNDSYAWTVTASQYQLSRGNTILAKELTEQELWQEVARYPEILETMANTRGIIDAALVHRAHMVLEGKDVHTMTLQLRKDIAEIYEFLVHTIGATLTGKRVTARKIRASRDFSPWLVKSMVEHTYLWDSESCELQLQATPDPLIDRAFGLRLSSKQRLEDYAVFRERIAFAFEKLTQDTGIQVVDPYQGNFLTV